MENNITAAAPAKAVYKRPSQAKEIWRRFRKGKGAVVGLICLVIILLAVLVGPLLIPYENATTQNFSNYLAKPSAEHLFGCRVWPRYSGPRDPRRQNVAGHRHPRHHHLLHFW